MISKQHWLYRIASSKHTYVYVSIVTGLVLSHPNLPWAIVATALCLAVCAMASAVGFLFERTANLKKLLSYEQAKVIMKDKEIQEAVRKRKEAYHKLRKASQPETESTKDLPLASKATVLPRTKLKVVDLKPFAQHQYKTQGE